MMDKYGVDHEKVNELLRLHLAKTREEAIEKVASGVADELLDKVKHEPKERE